MLRWVWRVTAASVCLFAVVAAAGASFEYLEHRRDLAMAPPPGRLIDVGGYRLHLWCLGKGTPAVVFDSGLGGTAFDWYPVLRDVSRFTTACAYDRAGMGYSDPAPSPRTARHISSELAELITRSDTKAPVVLVGWSDGGLYTREYASEHESETAGLVLVDAAHEDQISRFAAAGIPTGPPPFASLVPAAATLGMLRITGRPFGPRPDTEPEPVRGFVQATVYRSSRYRTMVGELTHFATSADEVRASRRPLSIPVVVLSSGRSPIPNITTPLQHDLLQLSKRSCQMVAVDSDHMILSEAPGLIVRATRAVIDAWRASSTPTCS